MHDFSFALIEAIKYNNWYYDEKVYDYIFNSEIIYESDYIPIGSVEFVLHCLEKFHNIKNVKPLNIPEELRKPKYLKRWVDIININTNTTTINFFDKNKSMFIKDNTKIKSVAEIFIPNRGYPPGEYLISEFIDIESEWRSFVFNKKLIGLQNYSGDFTMFPNVELINEMIKDYSNNGAYTLDVGINDKGTFVIECHDFFSCGLYGFADYKMLPLMFINTWNKLIK